MTGITTTAELIERAAQHWPDKTFIQDGDRILSFSATLDAVHSLSHGLLARGVGEGQRGFIWAPNCAEWIIAALAMQYIGATLVTLNTRYKGAEAAAIIRDSGATFGFVIDHFLGVDYPSLLEGEDLGALDQIFVIGATGDGSFSGLWEAGAALADEPSEVAKREALRARVQADTVSDILFTSGTTGRAKGVVTCHGQNLRAFASFASVLGLSDDDRYLIINPFFHSFGYKAGWLAALLSGATVYPLAVFDVATVLERIERDRITVMPGPPTLFQSILAHPELSEKDLSSLTKATTGAATIPTALIIAMREQLGIDTVLTAYGLSESCGLVTMCRPGDSAELIATTSGRAIPDVELGIMDSDGSLLPAGESGEIVVRGYNVMQGYLDNPIATRESIDAEGWLHTGDIGHVDAEGNLSITDRLKDMFICGGFNCYPAEIENQMLAHPSIAQVAVVGMPDDRLGEVAAAFIVPAAGIAIDTDAIITWCRDIMANYKVPRRVLEVDALPLNASGKVLKTELRQRLA